jgi:endonuclease-3 related protein
VKSDLRFRKLRAYYQTLYSAWGPQHWWPGRAQFEVIVGAYLTQNTSWKNVETAMRRLRSRNALSLTGIRNISVEELETMIRPAGYFRQKAARLKTFVEFVDQRYGGSLKRMFAQPTRELRRELLSLNGIGPETADSILLYAGQHPVFVVDAYARRILDRHCILPANSDYEEARELFELGLAGDGDIYLCEKTTSGRQAVKIAASGTAHTPSPMSRAKRSSVAQLFNDAHALIVAVGKHYCFKSHPDCEHCPLQRFLPNTNRMPSFRTAKR